MIRFLFTLICLASLGYGVWRLSDSHPELRDKATQFIPTSSYHAFEPRFTATQIMDNQRTILLKQRGQQYGNFGIEYHPYLLMEVKFSQSSHETGEGVILWDLIDGEMVLSTETWEKSHGFADCIYSHADQHEFEILTALAKAGNQADRGTLLKTLKKEGVLLDSWLDRCIRKKLVVKHGNLYRVHLQNPNLTPSPPLTHISIPLVTKNTQHSERLKKRFSISQIMRAAQAAFGEDFAIRSHYEVYLPIYSISVQNADGSFQTSHWNGLNGKCFLHATSLERASTAEPIQKNPEVKMALPEQKL